MVSKWMLDAVSQAAGAVVLKPAQRIKLYLQRHPGKAGADADRAIAGVEFIVKIDGAVAANGTTPASGLVEVDIPVGSTATLEMLGTSYELSLQAALEPVLGCLGQQRRLAALGYRVGSVDGVFGRATDGAVLDFQADTGLDSDGIAGPLTRSKITSEFGS